MKIKICSKCKEEKDINNFKNKHTWCQKCKQKYNKQYRDENKEKFKIYNKEWRDRNQEKIKALGSEYVKNNREKIKQRCKEWAKNNPDKVKTLWLKRAFGITLDYYNNMSEKQGNVCAICFKPETISDKRSQLTRALAVDHDHLNGNIRGLLCNSCNKGLGFFGDSEENLLKAIEYLKRAKI